MPTIRLTPNFTLQEFLYSQTAAREGIPNVPNAEELKNLKRTAEVMEKIRTICGSNPVTITSGYRGPELNAAVGGSTTSAHCPGLAADFIIPAFGDPHDVCRAIEPHMAELGIDQCIWEYGDWVHIGLCEPAAAARHQCLTITNAGTTEGF